MTRRMRLTRAVMSMMACAGCMILVAAVYSQPASAVPTTLAPGDVSLVTVNSDGAVSCGSNSSFEFVLSVDIGSGTVIKFADEGWDGNTGDWRSGSEGKVTYTAPTDIPAGTTHYYDDCELTTDPTVWSTGGVPDGDSGSFVLSTGGDNLLVYQGDDATPTFLYGIGWASSVPWITTGSPTTNESYVPPGISAAASTLVDLGVEDNYQLMCTVFDIGSGTFATDVANPANWHYDSTLPYESIDARCPGVEVDQADSQPDPTAVDEAVFQVVFSEPIDPASFTASDITLAGTSGTVTSGPVQSGPMDGTVFQFSVTGMTSGDTVVATVGFGLVEDIVGNISRVSTSIDNRVTYLPAVVTEAEPLPTEAVETLAPTGVSATQLGASSVFAICVGALALVYARAKTTKTY